MSDLIRALDASDVLLDLEAATTRQLFERVAALAEERHGLERHAVFDALDDRERLGSTALGHGVAIPHCRLRGLRESIAMLVRLRSPIDFASPDAAPVGLFAFLLVPEHATDVHLALLASLASLLSERRMRESLEAAGDAAAVQTVLARFEADRRRSPKGAS